MSASNINTLMDLWAATLLKHGGAPPFANSSDLYNTIDSIPLGDVPWQHFSLKYNGELPDGTIPEWMTSDYEVWFRDPHLIIKNMIGNPDYEASVDTTPIQAFDNDGHREYQNFMSGDWAWEEAVCFMMTFLF
jgi:Plavaka transposase